MAVRYLVDAQGNRVEIADGLPVKPPRSQSGRPLPRSGSTSAEGDPTRGAKWWDRRDGGPRGKVF